MPANVLPFINTIAACNLAESPVVLNKIDFFWKPAIESQVKRSLRRSFHLHGAVRQGGYG